MATVANATPERTVAAGATRNTDPKKIKPGLVNSHTRATTSPPPVSHPPLGIGRVSRDHFHNFGPLGRSVPYLARLVPF